MKCKVCKKEEAIGRPTSEAGLCFSCGSKVIARNTKQRSKYAGLKRIPGGVIDVSQFITKHAIHFEKYEMRNGMLVYTPPSVTYK